MILYAIALATIAQATILLLKTKAADAKANWNIKSSAKSNL